MLLLLILACSRSPSYTAEEPDPDWPATLVEARAATRTTVYQDGDATPAPTPPEGDLEIVHYPAPMGENVAYVTPVHYGKLVPAVLWIQGGLAWGLDESAWRPGPRDDDQSATGLRAAGIAQMYASLRGWNGNPGQPECMLGEVDDLLAAAKFLAARPDVDPARVYVAGHSTGGTLALLVAESSTMFRAAVAFGPVEDVRVYDACLPKGAPVSEWLPRAPWPWLHLLSTPTWIVEGADQGNGDSIEHLMTRAGDAPVTYTPVPDRTHFSVLASGVDQLAAAILADTGPTADLDLSAAAILARP